MMLLIQISLILLCLFGAFLSGYSIHEHILVTAGIDSGSAVCNISQAMNCKAVILSDWSTFLGIPLGSYGIGFYLFVLLCVVWQLLSKAKTDSVYVAFFAVTLSLVVSLFLFLVSKLIIGVLCPVCMLMYLTNVLLFVFFWILLKTENGLRANIVSGIRALPQYPLLFLVGAAAVFLSAGMLESIMNVDLAREQLRADREERILQAVRDWGAAPEVEIRSQTEPAHLQDYTVGSADAPIQVVEFFDYECPACRNFYGDLKDLLREFEGKVAVQYRNYPLDNNCNPSIKDLFHRNACQAALFARCAGEQGKFQDSLDYLMTLPEFDEHRESTAVREAILDGIEVLSLDETAMQECLASDRQLKKIQDDIAVANELELQSTPSVWVNGKKVSSLHHDVLKKIFEGIL